MRKDSAKKAFESTCVHLKDNADNQPRYFMFYTRKKNLY